MQEHFDWYMTVDRQTEVVDLIWQTFGHICLPIILLIVNTL